MQDLQHDEFSFQIDHLWLVYASEMTCEGKLNG
jgi:hypothetical protein